MYSRARGRVKEKHVVRKFVEIDARFDIRELLSSNRITI